MFPKNVLRKKYKLLSCLGGKFYKKTFLYKYVHTSASADAVAV